VRRKLRRAALTPVTAVRRRRGIEALRSSGHPSLRALADAVEATTRGIEDDRLRRRVDEIERLRREMAASTEPIELAYAELGDARDDRVVTETIADACGRSRTPLWCRQLLEMVLALRPASCVELGTCVGISSSYIAAALERNDHGRLVTIEAFAANVDIARRSFARLGLQRVEARRGTFEQVLTDVLAEQRPVDFVFVDGNHDEGATLGYAAAVKPFLAEDAIVVFDDISFSDGMERAWRRLASDPDATAAVDLGPVGLCLYGGPPAGQRLYDVPLEVKPKGADRGWLSG
jgi:predicted O-methyltransferase YrrM